ncbi:GL14054 [Drosophila persimilis]|uniref:GL14054 n=1 Tax=Drosophila persimilis TaxID=7234 RepID=B4GQP9_DROPE|nr:GL14054 [Drosophila persimilis]
MSMSVSVSVSESMSGVRGLRGVGVGCLVSGVWRHGLVPLFVLFLVVPKSAVLVQ